MFLSKRVKATKEFISLVNQSLEILDEPRLSKIQGVMIMVLMIITAMDISSSRNFFVKKLDRVFEMQPGVEQKQELARLLGLGDAL
jgi:hypothetical protein